MSLPSVHAGAAAFDNGDELQELHAIVAEVRVNVADVVAVVAVDGYQHIEFDPVPLEQFQPAMHGVERGTAFFVVALAVVQFGRPVDRNADEKIVRTE